MLRGTTIDKRDRSGHADGNADTLKRGAYVFASRGLVGLALWFTRGLLVRFAANFATGRNVAIGLVVLLALMLGARNLHETHRSGIIQSRAYAASPTDVYQWRHRELVQRQYRQLPRRQWTSSKRRYRPARLYVSLSDYLVHKLLSWLETLAMMGMVGLGTAGIAGALYRRHQEAWETEHGAGTKAFRDAEAAALRGGADPIGRDDWLVNPPARQRHEADAAPRFGQRRGPVVRRG